MELFFYISFSWKNFMKFKLEHGNINAVTAKTILEKRQFFFFFSGDWTSHCPLEDRYILISWSGGGLEI